MNWYNFVKSYQQEMEDDQAPELVEEVEVMPDLFNMTASQEEQAKFKNITMSLYDFSNNGVLSIRFSEKMYSLDEIAKLIRRRVGKRMLS